MCAVVHWDKKVLELKFLGYHKYIGLLITATSTYNVKADSNENCRSTMLTNDPGNFLLTSRFVNSNIVGDSQG